MHDQTTTLHDLDVQAYTNSEIYNRICLVGKQEAFQDVE